MLSKLQYISQGLTVDSQVNNIREALDAGCNWIQLRFKNGQQDEILRAGDKAKKLCAVYGAKLIINDHPAIAKLVDADGVHLGLTDLPVDQAKRIAGDHKIIGGTANTIDDIRKRVKEGCTYIGLGPLRYTTTKQNLSPILGIEGYRQLMAIHAAEQLLVPVFSIGGVEAADIDLLMNIGVYGIAVSGVITHHPRKKLLLQELNTHLYATTNHSR